MFVLITASFTSINVYAACSGTSITWGGLVSSWNTAGNWSPANIPNLASEDVVIAGGTPTVNVTTNIGCLSLTSGAIDGSSNPARILTFQGDSFTSTPANALNNFSKLSLVMGPHFNAGGAQTFTMNQSTTMISLKVSTASTPGAGAFGATITNTNAGTATFTTLSNTAVNSTKIAGNILATTYTNTAANSVDVFGGTFTVNTLNNTNTVSGGSFDVHPGGTLKSLALFNPVAGFTTTVESGTPLGILNIATTSAPAGTQIINGTMTTTQYNPVSGSSTTVGSTGTLTASASATPAAGSSLSVSGTFTTPVFNPASTATITVNSGGALNATTSSTPGSNITIASGGVFTVATYSPASTSTTTINGTMTVSAFTPGAGATININSGGVLNATNFTPNATTVINVAAGGTLNITNLASSLAATVSISGTATVTNLPSITSGVLDVKAGGRLIFTNGANINGATITVRAGGTVQIANTKTLALGSGTFQILGTEDDFPQSLATKGVVEALSGGSFNFNTTGGTLSLTGFHFDRLGINGINIGGTTIVTNLRGGQLSHLPTSYASVKAIQINTTGTIPVSASRIAWNWGAFNVFTGTNPTSAQAYQLVSSTGCASHSIDFSGWTGDWYETQPNFNVTTKVSASGCTINMGASSSAVSLLSFLAVPFNAAIDLRWRTNAERNHLGFNVYRSDLYSSQFQQINKTLIRNLLNSGSNQASYRFIDQDVTNNQIYYYYIEDVEVTGKKVMHGPVSATPLLTLGVPPADNAGENSETNPNDSDDGGTSGTATIPNPGYEDLGNGVVIIGKTSSSIRLEITPPAPNFSASAWNGAYQDVSVAGYSKMTTVGSPELPEKDILIEVQSYAQSAHVINASVTDSTLAAHLIAPAPNYVLNTSGVMIASYAADATRYASASEFPGAYYSVQSELISGAHTKFLKIKVNPLLQNALNQSLKVASKIILDIGLDGDDWDVKTPPLDTQLSPYSISNTLRIDYVSSGVYQISYQDFINSGVEAPFLNQDMGQWRLYNKLQEIPLEIHSSTGLFSSGDYIRFYVPFEKNLESLKNQLILSPVNITESGSDPLRMEVLDANPGNESESIEALSKITKVFEQNKKYIDGVTLDDSLDHFFYADLVSFPGMNTLSTVVNLPEIDRNNSENVKLKYFIRGRVGIAGLPVKHHVSVSLAGVVKADAVFENNDRQELSFEIPASQFVVGNNTVAFKVLGTYAPANDYDLVLVDKMEITYNGFVSGLTGVSTFITTPGPRAQSVAGFNTNQILGYDISDALNPKKLSNMLVTTNNGGATYSTKFFISDDPVDTDNLKHFTILGANSLLKPSTLSLNPGVGDENESLKSSTNRADLIVYGDENLISALGDLIERRRSQGLDVLTVTPEQIYAEFSFGVPSSSALKTFVNTALNHWEKAPRFLLILGDGTYDPKDYNVAALPVSDRSVLERGTLPAPIIAGRFIDFSGDNFFASEDNSQMPRLAVGRLPTNDPEKIKVYVDKIKNYEDGDSAPVSRLRKITFFADEDTGNYERFNQISKDLMASTSGFSSELFDRSELGSGAATKTKISAAFNEGPLMISLLGHGAFDRFGDDIFNVTDANLLTNSVLPIVASWSCESAYFYDADKTYKSLAEELIFNPNGGAIVYMGSTTQTTPPAQAKLAQNFFAQLSSLSAVPWTGVRFGELLYQAKLQTGNGVYEKDIVNSFSIIGDPSLMLPSRLFPDEARPPVIETPKKKGSLFGCTANAGDGADQTPWHEGLVEWMIYMLMIIFCTRLVTRKTINR